MKALITGVTGQDGAYLAKFLLSKNYRVVGSYRRTSTENFWRLKNLGVLGHSQFDLVEHDVTDLASTLNLVSTIEPDEIYNLAAQSFVGVSFKQPLATANITGLGALNILEAIRIVNKHIKFYQASTSEMFGLVQEIPQNEQTQFYPRSPYGVAKLFAHWTTINYRESYGIYATSGILFNHESPLRGPEFVTRKISMAAAEVGKGKRSELLLGNLDAERDWGFAGDYVEGMWKMLQNSIPDTFVLATGAKTTVRDFATMAFSHVGIDLKFEGAGIDEVGIDAANGSRLIRVSPEFFRPAEVEILLGDPSKAKIELDWAARTTVSELAAMMVQADFENA